MNFDMDRVYHVTDRSLAVVNGAVHRVAVATDHTFAQLDRVTDRRQRLGGAIVLVLILHVVMMIGFSQMQGRPMAMPDFRDDEPVPVDLWSMPPPPPEPQPKIRAQQETAVETPQPQPLTPTQTATSPQPTPQTAPQAVPQPTPQPTPEVVPKIVVASRPQEVLQPVAVPTAQTQKQQSLQNSPVPSVAVAPEPVVQPSPEIKLKKKEEEALQAKAADSDISDSPTLKLHEATAPSVQAMAPSGLTAESARIAASLPSPPSGGGAPASSGTPSSQAGGLAGAAAASLIGKGMKGRGALTQAMQNHSSCVALQGNGKTMPTGCAPMKDMAAMSGMGLKADKDLQAAVAQKEAYAKYKAAPGNADYWQRVGHVPSASDHAHNDLPTPGAYSNTKDQRVMTGTDSDPKSSGPH